MSKTVYLIFSIVAILVGTVFNYSLVAPSTGSSGSSRSYGGGAAGGSSSSGWHK